MDFRSVIQTIREKNSRVLVVGMGISGVETVAFLLRLGIRPVAVEKQAEDKYSRGSKLAARVQELITAGAEIHFGVDGEDVRSYLSEVALCVLSPGVSLESAICGVLNREKIPLVSELELGIELLGWPTIMVTGSNGKTTTVSLIAKIIEVSGQKVRLCGNVGTPVVSELSEACLKPAKDPGVLVVEASSYQLESCSVVKPKVGVLLNISDNHLERHGTLERYFEVKARLFARQDSSDFAVINATDRFYKQLQARVNAKILAFSGSPTASVDAVVDYDPSKGVDRLKIRFAGTNYILEMAEAQLIGLHNRENVAAAALATLAIGVPIAVIQKAVAEFKPLAHRLEFVRELKGRKWINDSKSTTVAASVAAVNAVLERYSEPLTLLLGGQSKAGSWDPVFSLLNQKKERLSQLICFGGDARLLASHAKRHGVQCLLAANLAEAVKLAQSSAGPTDLVLLSPGCASFDEFTDFEHRGDVFKSLVSSVAG